MLYHLDKENKDELTVVKTIALNDFGWLEENLENLISQNIEKIVREDQLLVFSKKENTKKSPI